MTTEDDFHRMLDANPDDHQTRLVLADFLEDSGDPRAAGYRALGTLGKSPLYVSTGRNYWTFGNYKTSAPKDNSDLPKDWYKILHKGIPIEQQSSGFPTENWWSHFDERRHAEDAAAHAFSKLPPERQAELLNQTEKLSRVAETVRMAAGELPFGEEIEEIPMGEKMPVPPPLPKTPPRLANLPKREIKLPNRKRPPSPLDDEDRLPYGRISKVVRRMRKR